MNAGWHVSAGDIIRQWSDNRHSYSSRRLLVDAAPNSKKKIEIIEILDVYAFTIGDEQTKEVWWTPLMLNIRGVLHRDDVRDLTEEQRKRIVHQIVAPRYSEDIREFLYIRGHAAGWNWGMSGKTNAAYLEPEARKYFRNYF